MGSLWMLALAMPALYAVLWLVSRPLGRRGVQTTAGYLVLVVGLRRHGKSLFVARLMAERAKAGVPVFANFPARGCGMLHTWFDAILAPRRSMIVIDEVHQWAGSMAGRTLRPAARWYVAMCGHLGHEVYVIAQHEQQVPSEIVAQINEVIECKGVGQPKVNQETGHVRFPGGHRASSYAPHQFRKRDARPLWSWKYSARGPAIEFYDTHALIPPEPTRSQKYEDDVERVAECIAIIEARETSPRAPLVDDQVTGWLEAAGLA